MFHIPEQIDPLTPAKKLINESKDLRSQLFDKLMAVFRSLGESAEPKVTMCGEADSRRMMFNEHFVFSVQVAVTVGTHPSMIHDISKADAIPFVFNAPESRFGRNQMRDFQLMEHFESILKPYIRRYGGNNISDFGGRSRGVVTWQSFRNCSEWDDKQRKAIERLSKDWGQHESGLEGKFEKAQKKIKELSEIIDKRDVTVSRLQESIRRLEAENDILRRGSGSFWPSSYAPSFAPSQHDQTHFSYHPSAPGPFPDPTLAGYYPDGQSFRTGIWNPPQSFWSHQPVQPAIHQGAPGFPYFNQGPNYPPSEVAPPYSTGSHSEQVYDQEPNSGVPSTEAPFAGLSIATDSQVVPAATEEQPSVSKAEVSSMKSTTTEVKQSEPEEKNEKC